MLETNFIEKAMIEKYIIEFLKENNRLIIPDLGAFIVKVYSEENTRELTFNDVIKFNDNSFANFIANAENIDFETAKHKIEEFVIKTNDELNEGVQVQILDAGFLMKDGKGYINFTKEKSEQKIVEEVKVEEPKVNETHNEEAIELIQEDIFASKTEEKEENIEIKTESVHSLKEQSIEDVYGLKEKLPKELQKEKELEEKLRKEEEKKRKIEEEKHNEELKKKEKAEKKRLEEEQKRIKKSEKPKGKKSKKGLFVIISLVVLIVVLGGGYMFKHQIKEQFAKLSHGNDSVAVENITIGNDSTSLANSNKNVAKQTGNPANTTTSDVNANLSPEEQLLKDESNFVSVDIKNHVIAGSFETRLEAAKYLIEIRNQGYEAKFLIAQQKIRVTYGSFTSRDEAKEFLNSVKAKGVKDVWMLAE